MKYAIVKSRYVYDYIKPFEGCYPVVSETNKFVFVEKRTERKDEIEVMQLKISKGNILCFSEKDITETLRSLNDTVEESWNAHTKMVKHAYTLAVHKANEEQK